MIQDPSAPRYTNPRAAPKYHLRRAVLHITNPHGWRDTSVSGQSLLSQWRTDPSTPFHLDRGADAEAEATPWAIMPRRVSPQDVA